MAEDCEKVTFYAPTATVGGDVKVPSCVPGEKRIPPELTNPSEEYATEYVYSTPRKVVVGNLPAHASCDEGSYGDTVVIAAWLYTTEVSIPVTVDLSDEVLDKIAKENIVDWIETAVHDNYSTYLKTPDSTLEELSSELSNLSGMPVSSAKELFEALFDEQKQVNDIAQSAADTALYCYWRNKVQVARCDDFDNVAGPDVVTSAVREFIVTADTFTSDVSQEDVDEIALEFATSKLYCIYANDQVTATCHATEKNINLGYEEEVPNDSAPVLPNLEKRVGTYTVLEGTFTSELSKQAVNEQAQTFALRQLVCFYVNDPVHTNCNDINARYRGESPSHTQPSEANLQKNKKGQIVNIPKGYVTSNKNTKSATNEAKTLAESMLECCFINKAIHEECAAKEVTDSSGKKKLVYPNKDASPVFSVDIEEGRVSGCESQGFTQEIVDAEARALVEGVLQCYYCNDKIIPSCVPDWVALACGDGINITNPDGSTYVYKLSVPLDLTTPIVNPFTNKLEDITKWSTSATVGAAKDSICALEWEQAEQLADSNALIKITDLTEEDCVYVNDEVVAACAANDPYNESGTIPVSSKYPFIKDTTNPNYIPEYYTPYREVYSPYSDTSTTKRKEKPYIFYTQFRLADLEVVLENETVYLLSNKLSSPGIGSHIVVPEGTFSVTKADVPDGGDPKAYANQLAEEFALSMLFCYFGNHYMTGSCTDKKAERLLPRTTLASDKWKTGKGITSTNNLAPGSTLSTNPITVPTNVFISKDTLGATYDEAENFISSLLQCQYCNDPQLAKCSNSSDLQVSQAYVPYCAVRADSVTEANAMAKSMAESMLVCLDPAKFVGVAGPAGPAGPAGAAGPAGPAGPAGSNGKDGTGCDGTCFGVYS